MTLVSDTFVLESFSTDFEPFQGTFFKDISEDCYLVKEKACAGDDLWKNVSLPPTPPISPASSPLYSGTTDESRSCQQECNDDEDELALCGETSLYFQTDNLKEILIKDCMWNGAAFDASERRRSLRARVQKGRLLCQTPPLSESAARILSVDPTEIFPFPIHGSSSTTDDESVELEQSESDDEEVEVDVVTIENSIKREEDQVKNLDEDDTVMAIESELSDFSTPFQSANEEQEDERDEFVGKIRHRRYRKSNSDGLSCSSRKSSSSKAQPNCSGESDESENDSEFTRATHNVLERKRRNDLKLKFQRLRDCVPELQDNERAPKVSILRKSWEYISTLKLEDSKLKQEYEKQKKTNALLLRQLLALNQASQ